jgi:hypothetical protein
MGHRSQSLQYQLIDLAVLLSLGLIVCYNVSVVQGTSISSDATKCVALAHPYALVGKSSSDFAGGGSQGVDQANIGSDHY